MKTLKHMFILVSSGSIKVAAPDGKGKVDDYWEACKKELLGDPRLIDRITTTDVKPKVREPVTIPAFSMTGRWKSFLKQFM
eukprot:6139250-Amphidinium_carterae.1